MENKDDDIVIYDDEGKEYLMKVLFTYENEDRHSEYVFIYDSKEPSDIYVMKYNDKHELYEVEDEEEFNEAQEVLEAFNKDPEINEIKDDGI